MPDNWDFSQSRQRQADPLAQVPILTYLLAALSVIITGASMLGPQAGTLVSRIGTFGYADADEIWAGHVWGLVTTVFIHGGILHLLFNMLWLVQLGRVLERTLPQAVYLAFMIAAAAVGSATEMLVSGTTGIGMSGVVYAMFGLLWAGRGYDASWRAIATLGTLQYLVGWGLFCIVATYLHWLPVANGAHAGGFLFGLCIGYLFYSPRRRYFWAAPLTVLLAASVLACTWQPWSANWTFWKGNKEFDRKHYARAIGWYEASLRRGGSPHDNWSNISLAWNNIAVDAQDRKDAGGEVKALAEKESAAQKAGE